MTDRDLTVEGLQLDRAAAHRVIAALQKRLEAIGHTHTGRKQGVGYCRVCGYATRFKIPVFFCFDCGHYYCGVHINERLFADAKQQTSFHRLRMKIHRLEADLAQGRLFTSG